MCASLIFIPVLISYLQWLCKKPRRLARRNYAIDELVAAGYETLASLKCRQGIEKNLSCCENTRKVL